MPRSSKKEIKSETSSNSLCNVGLLDEDKMEQSYCESMHIEAIRKKVAVYRVMGDVTNVLKKGKKTDGLKSCAANIMDLGLKIGAHFISAGLLSHISVVDIFHTNINLHIPDVINKSVPINADVTAATIVGKSTGFVEGKISGALTTEAQDFQIKSARISVSHEISNKLKDIVKGKIGSKQAVYNTLAAMTGIPTVTKLCGAIKQIVDDYDDWHKQKGQIITNITHLLEFYEAVAEAEQKLMEEDCSGYGWDDSSSVEVTGKKVFFSVRKTTKEEVDDKYDKRKKELFASIQKFQGNENKSMNQPFLSQTAERSDDDDQVNVKKFDFFEPFRKQKLHK